MNVWVVTRIIRVKFMNAPLSTYVKDIIYVNDSKLTHGLVKQLTDQ